MLGLFLAFVIAPCARASELAQRLDFLQLLLRHHSVDFRLAVSSNAGEAEEETGEPDKAEKQWGLALRDEHGKIDPTALYRANVLRRASLKKKAGTSSRASIESVTNPSSWVTRGPLNVGGRTRCVVVDPN